MKTGNLIIRFATLALAWVHTFPALKHLGLFVRAPSLMEAWKGFGGAFAVLLYLLPPSWQARGLATLWMRNRRVLVGAGWALACAHLIPAIDHLPRFIDAPSWADAWRGVGASLAAIWFVLPLGMQAQVLGTLRGPRARTAPSLLAFESDSTRRRHRSRIEPSLESASAISNPVSIRTRRSSPALSST